MENEMKKVLDAKYHNQSSLRLLQILECMSKNRYPMKLLEIAEGTGISQSTLLRYLYVLREENYVYQSQDTGRYALTWRICNLTQNLDNNHSLRTIASQYYDFLISQFGLGICLAVEMDNSCLYLDSIKPATPRTLQRIGRDALLHTTASGKILLSKRNNEKLDNYVEQSGLFSFTTYTIHTAEKLKHELETIRKQDYAIDDEECEVGIRCVAVPLRDYTGQIVAALSLFGDKIALPDNLIQNRIIPELKRVAKSISKNLGYQSAENN